MPILYTISRITQWKEEILSSTPSAAETADTAPTPRSVHGELLVPKALPFDPKKLDGLSEKMIVSHHDNNYVSAVKRARVIEEKSVFFD